MIETTKMGLLVNSWRSDLTSAAFGKISAVYGHIDKNGHLVRKRPARKMAITDKMVKNSRLSVRFQTFWTRIYGQITGKCRFVRKMRFAYGQIIKNELFVRKIGWDLDQIIWAALHLKKEPRQSETL